MTTVWEFRKIGVVILLVSEMKRSRDNFAKIFSDLKSNESTDWTRFLDRNIRMVTICDTDGKIMYSDHRPGVTNLLTPDESRKSLEMAVNAWKSRSQLAPKIGKGKYVLAEYEKIKRITMPLGDRHLVYVTTELQANHVNIISGIISLSSSLANAS